jgi:hypothetical protein
MAALTAIAVGSVCKAELDSMPNRVPSGPANAMANRATSHSSVELLK